MLPCVCSVINHRRRQNVVRTSVTLFLFLPHFDIFCDLLLNRRTVTWNLYVKYRHGRAYRRWRVQLHFSCKVPVKFAASSCRRNQRRTSNVFLWHWPFNQQIILYGQLQIKPVFVHKLLLLCYKRIVSCLSRWVYRVDDANEKFEEHSTSKSCSRPVFKRNVGLANFLLNFVLLLNVSDKS